MGVAPLRGASLRRAAALVAALAVAACAGPSRTVDDYRHKAANTAEAMVSAVETAKLAADTLLHDRTFSAAASVTVTDAEGDGDSVQATFDSVQPPSAEADTIRDHLDDALTEATSALADLRIAVRRGDLDGVREAVASLDKVLPALHQFEKLA